MATTYYPDFSKLSQYDETSGTIAVRFGADAPITEQELNEMQLIQNKKRNDLTKFLFTNGFDKDANISFSSGTLTITDSYAVVDGYLIYIDSVTLSVASGATAYLNIFEKQTVGPNDTMKKYGNEGGTTITNYIMDARYNQEISKRIVLAYSLTTSPVSGAKTLAIGTNNSGTFSFTYDYIGLSGVEAGGGLDSKGYLYADGKEITLTPAELAAKRDAGDFDGLEIGDYVNITLEGDLAGTTITMEIAGMDVYYGYSSNNKHTIDFVCRDIPFKHRVHSSNDTVGGYTQKELYTYLETTVYNCLPAAWRAVIQAKKCLLENKSATASTGWAWADLKLWLLDEMELFGYHSWGQLDYGIGNAKHYPLFQSERHIIKKFNGSAWWYWLLNPSKINTTYWCYCDSDGSSYDGTTASNDNGGVVFGFRI